MALYRAEYAATSSARSNPRPASDNGEMTSDCAICLESLQKSLAALRCGHVFHHTCLREALALRHACPVCRRKANPNSAVRLYLSVGGAVDKGTSNCAASSSCPTSNESTTATRARSCLPERMNEMRRDLDRMYQIQRMTSSHSFRLENNLVRQRQKLDQSRRRLHEIQRELDSARVQVKRWQRIATTNYAQARRTKAEIKLRVLSTADRMLQKIQERRRLCRCASCANEWGEMKCTAQELATVFGPCCSHHSHGTPTPTSTSQTAPRSHHQCDYLYTL